MPVGFGLWRIDGELLHLTPRRIESESRLEELLEQEISILGGDLMIIGRQVVTEFGKQIDLLAINPDGDLVTIELKRDRTPREVVAQLLDYGSWVRDLGYDDIVSLFSDYSTECQTEHHFVVVATELDNSTERIVRYLSECYGMPINALFFGYFEDGEREYLARTWLIDPVEADTGPEGSTRAKQNKERWNGQDFYVALGEGPHRSWDDCVRYGFVSGGQGRWYSRTLNMLFRGARVFVHVPNAGYVGVGTVEETARMVREFTVHSTASRLHS